jgi:hypothetical protein|nr:hypothetical protein [bacterium]
MEIKSVLMYSLENWSELILPEGKRKQFLDDCEKEYGLTRDEEVTQEDFEELYKDLQEK